eukprot:m.362081 g.362081  ORF g.362081 m.362081 type:complete len:90 (+) comp56013_c1_seq1:806-1075(+)
MNFLAALAARISSQQKQGSIQAVFGTEPKLTAREFKLVDFPFPGAISVFQVASFQDELVRAVRFRAVADFHPHGIGYFEDERSADGPRL